jgi:hypothetical protein
MGSNRTQLLRAKACLLLVLVLLPSQALALSEATKHLVQFDAVWHSDTPPANCTVSSDPALIGSDNTEIAFRYYVQKGLAATQSAGIVGNFIVESHVNPTATNSIGAHGIAQWYQGRRTALEKFAKDQGRNVDDLGTQLDFSWQELNNSYPTVLRDVKASTDVAGSATPIFKVYENPGDGSLPDRIAKGQKVLELYGGSTPTGTTVSSTSGGCSGISGPGQDSKFVDGFLVYSQYDPAWKDHPYSSSTIGDSGCGPSAMAMIITALTGTSVNPVATTDYAASQGMYVPGEGSSWSIGPVLAKHWGLTAQPVGADVGKISAAIQAGGLVVASGNGSLPFTKLGHFIVVRGVTASGKFKVGDSAHDNTSDQEWDPQQLVSQMHSGSVYAITKSTTNAQ